MGIVGFPASGRKHSSSHFEVFLSFFFLFLLLVLSISATLKKYNKICAKLMNDIIIRSHTIKNEGCMKTRSFWKHWMHIVIV